MTGRRRPGEHKQVTSWDGGGYDIALDRQVRAKAILTGQSIGRCSPKEKVHWSATFYSYHAGDKHKRIEQPLPTRYEIEAMKRVLEAGRLNDALPMHLALSIGRLATRLAIDNLRSEQRARPIGVEVATALELIASPRYRRLNATHLADTDIPY